MEDLSEVIRQLSADKGISEETVLTTVEAAIKAAYKNTYGTSDNAVVKFADDLSDVSVYARKTVTEEAGDPVLEISLEDARALNAEAAVGDLMDILVDPRTFDRTAVQAGKQTARLSFSEGQKDSLFAEFHGKEGEIIIGYYQRENRKGDIFVDLGKTEGFLPKKFQSPRETYERNDRIKALIKEVKNTNAGLQIVLSRTDPEFVRSIMELEVPEVYDKTVEIHKIVREPGYRTKIAVYSDREDVDPVGACVGLKGVRIQAVIRELYGEKIDVLLYDEDPRVFIKNALSPAEVSSVAIIDYESKKAVAVVADAQFSLAIGKQGQNVRLANKLADYSIDVLTPEQYTEKYGNVAEESRRAAEQLFGDSDETAAEAILISGFEGVEERIADILKAHNLDDVDVYLAAVHDKSVEQIEELTADDRTALERIIADNVEIVEEGAEEESAEAAPEKGVERESAEEAAAAAEDEEEYSCPECGGTITADMTVCPQCGTEISFEYEDEA